MKVQVFQRCLAGAAVTLLLGGATTATAAGMDFEQVKAKARDILYGHCADIGRDPSEITLSTHLRYDPDAGAAAILERAPEALVIVVTALLTYSASEWTVTAPLSSPSAFPASPRCRRPGRWSPPRSPRSSS